MKNINFFLALAFMSATVSANTYEKYDFPISNPLLATLTVVTNNTDVKYNTAEIEIRADRKNIPLLEGRHKIKVALFKQKQNAPLVFIVSGLGGSGISGSSLLLAEVLHKSGYHVVTLPNPLSWQYTLGVSETATPGYMARDSKEYYIFMKKVMAHLENKEKIKATNYSLMGFSLGGLFSAYLAKEDSVRKAFNFQKTVLVNPAVDLKYGLDVIDGFFNEGLRIPEQQRTYAYATILDIGDQILNSSAIDANVIGKILPKASSLSNADLKWVIAQSFRGSLRDVVYASQQIRDTGLLKGKATKHVQNNRLTEAYMLSFSDYVLKSVLPTLENTRQADEVIHTTGLIGLEQYIKSNKKMYVIGNADDFILSQKDLVYLKSMFGSRLMLYPAGGHMGNLWWPRNKSDLGILFPVVK